MALETGQKRAIWAVLGLAAVLVAAMSLSCSRQGDPFLVGEAKGAVASVEWIPLHPATEIPVHVLEWPALDEGLASADPPMTWGEFINLDCGLIVDDDVRHVVYTEDPDCHAVVLSFRASFDLMISYADGYCNRDATIIVRQTEDLLHFTVDADSDRGNCESIRRFLAKGIYLTDEAKGL